MTELTNSIYFYVFQYISAFIFLQIFCQSPLVLWVNIYYFSHEFLLIIIKKKEATVHSRKSFSFATLYVKLLSVLKEKEYKVYTLN